METIDGAKYIAGIGLPPVAIAIPPKQGTVLMKSHDYSSDATHSRSEMPLCPAYRFCRESKRPYRSPMHYSGHDQQITTLHDLLQAIKEAALRLIQLITSDIEVRRKDIDPRIYYPDTEFNRSKQSHSPGSGLIATTSSSVCALCGVALQPKDSSESEQFVIGRERSDDYSRDILLKHLDNMFFKMNYKMSLPAERGKTSDNLPIPGGALDYILSEENDSVNIRAKAQEKISSKTQSTDTSDSGLKLFFIPRPAERTKHQIRQDESQRKYGRVNQMSRYITNKREIKSDKSSHQCIIQVSSTISFTQDASTLTQDVLCPCACGLLVRDGTESEGSINPTPELKDKSVKTKLKEVDLHLDSRETKVRSDMIKVTKTRTQKFEKDTNVKRWIEEITQLRLQVQIEELHKNIQFFKRENKYIRRLAEKCRCLSEDIQGLQQLLLIGDTYSGLVTTMEHLQAQYHNEHGIIATLTGIFRGSINIQQIVAKLLAPLFEHWNPRDNIVTAGVSSAPRAQVASLKSSSSIVLNVY